MAASLSRPDPSSPASVAEAGFSTARRGYQQDEVRAFLTSVAAELGRLQERERQLDAELRDLRDRPAESAELDDETVAAMLGEETLRVLHTARESASEIKIRAEENAARILREANDEANRLRQEAEVEAARRRQDSSSDAEAEVALAKQQGREMVNEARAYRERVLADLERRTTLARHQIEELVHGRDRLLQVFERARLVAVDVTSELHAIDGPDELVNLTPTTGPVPLMVPRARADAPDQVDDADSGADETDETDEADQQPETSDDVAESHPAHDQIADDDDQPGEDATDGHEGATDAAADADGVDDADDVDDVDAGDVADDAGAAKAPGADANVVSLFRDRDRGDDEAAERADVGGIFERLRSEVPGDDTTDETTDDTTATAGDADGTTGDADGTTDDGDGDVDVESTPFSRRDEALVPLIVTAARKVKRVLADEQNGVLDTLRQQDPVTSVDTLLPDDHLAHYVAALEEELVAAAAAGATELGVNDTKTLRRKLGKSGALDAVNAMIADDLVGPLRDRLARATADGSGDNDDITKRVRAVYREWKTQHIDDQLDDVFRAAYGGGIATTVEPGTALVWTIDPAEPACADCEDNSLAGPVAAGDAYPTGHTSAPAHPGCRCLTVPAAQ